MEHEELTNTIIGCAYKVHNVLGYGFLESVYEKAMRIELHKAGLCAEAQKDIGLLINFGEKSVQVKRKVRDMNYYKNPVNPVNLV